jgi:hypothetical protein
MTTVVAHAGHWITSVIYVAPLIAFLVWLLFVAVRDRLQERDKP